MLFNSFQFIQRQVQIRTNYSWFQINFSDHMPKILLNLDYKVEAMALDWKGHYLYIAYYNQTGSLMTKPYMTLIRVGFISDNKRTTFVGKPTPLVETSASVGKLVVDAGSNNVLFYSSKMFSSSETFQLSRIVFASNGSVIDHGQVRFVPGDGSCLQVDGNGTDLAALPMCTCNIEVKLNKR